jgi:phage tail sheath protein FI
MAEKIVSPGVFTNEKDLSFLPAGVAAIGAAIVGPTQKGPAFVPTIITNFEDFRAMFGELTEESYVPYAVKSYLRAASTVTVVRVLSEGGYGVSPLYINHTTGGVTFTVGVILPTTTIGSTNGKDYTATTVSSTNLSATASVSLILSGSGIPSQSLTASGNPTNVSSFANVLGRSVKGSKNGFMYLWFSDYLATTPGLSGSLSFVSASSTVLFDVSSSTNGIYRPASTPYITTQYIGAAVQNLFRFHTLADGNDTNRSVKVSIENTTLPGGDPASDYGSFTVVVRAYDDTDQRPNVLETYTNLNLDPDSVNYVARRIGDRAYSVNSAGLVTITGDYNNVSKYIRVEVAEIVAKKSVTTTAKPFGFVGLFQPIKGTVPPPILVTNSGSYSATTFTEIQTTYTKKAYYGWNFSSVDNANWSNPIPAGAVRHPSASLFNLDDCFVHPSASKTATNSSFVGGASISGSTFAGLDVANILKFTVPFQDGFDGMDPAIPKRVGAEILPSNLFGLDCTTASSKGAVGYIKALNVINNADEYDVNLIVAPGATIQDHPAIINKAIEVAEERGDCFVIADPVIQGITSPDPVVAAIQAAGIDSSYVATYWPWVKILDTDRNKPVWVPPSVVLPRVIAANDAAAYEWFAPAGLNRGGIADAVDIEKKLNQAQRNELYENRINAIAAFPNQGVCVWGQKTLQSKPSALDRVNVRRLLITLKKFIASSSRYLVFENNTTATRQRFINIVTPYLETVKARQGLYAFRVVMDETNNTPDVIDRNILYGQIYLQPAKAAEFIVLDFNILRTGATFENA